MASIKIQFSLRVTGQERKSIAAAISGSINAPVKYTGVPSCAYQIGGWTLDRKSVLYSPELEENELLTIKPVITTLNAVGLGADGLFAVTIPDLEDQAAVNLGSILKSKQQLLKSALQSEHEIQFQKGENSVSFSCFHAILEVDTILAYLFLTAKLCDMAKILRYASPVERPANNEKYAFRCFLLRLGFIGPEYKAERKILLAPLEGNTAFKNKLQEEVAE